MNAGRHGLPEALGAPPPGPVLVLAPHPDDDLLGPGGTLALHRGQGDPVRVAICFDGAAGEAPGAPAGSGAELVAARRRECLAGGRHLGLEDYLFLGAPEGHLPAPAELLAAARRLAELIRASAPATLYAPWVGEHHLDHHVLARAARLAVVLADFRGSALGYEVWSALEPQRVVDISPVVALKERALGEHRSQLAHTDLVAMILGLNAHRSLYLPKGATHGEAFAPLGPPEGPDRELLAGA